MNIMILSLRFGRGRSPEILSAAWGSVLERCFYNDHDRKVNVSTSKLVSLLRPRLIGWSEKNIF